ncbi:MAG: branched-chain amino acid ABC transporter permease [Acholeplasma sp.]|nr:branched-chain amino acid ABC transporter permease [Acholeplasma sp.]
MKKIMNTIKLKLKNPLYQFILFGFLMILLPLLSPFLSVTTVDALAKTLIYFVVALGFSLLIGYGGLASLGTSSFIAIGTFVAYAGINEFEIPFLVTILLGVVIAMLVGLIFGIVSLRIEGMYLAIVTLGLSEIMIELFKNFDRFTGGVSGTTSRAIQMFGLALTSSETLFIIVIAVVIAMILTYNLINSPFGRALLSIKNNDSAAQAMGISIIKYRLIAFIVSTVYAVTGGILYMGYIRFSMGSTWGLAISLNILAAVVVGGAKSIWGVLLGTFMIFGMDLILFKNIPFLADSKFANLSFVISGLLIILVTMFYPNGLAGLINEVKYKIKKMRLNKKAAKDHE